MTAISGRRPGFDANHPLAEGFAHGRRREENRQRDFNLEGKNALIEQAPYHELITDWAKKTGRKTRA